MGCFGSCNHSLTVQVRVPPVLPSSYGGRFAGGSGTHWCSTCSSKNCKLFWTPSGAQSTMRAHEEHHVGQKPDWLESNWPKSKTRIGYSRASSHAFEEDLGLPPRSRQLAVGESEHVSWTLMTSFLQCVSLRQTSEMSGSARAIAVSSNEELLI